MSKEGYSADDMSGILNTQSGLKGITGKYVDRREIIAAANQGDDAASSLSRWSATG